MPFEKKKNRKEGTILELQGEKKKEPSSFPGDGCGKSAQKAPISVISETQEW
jgi:hypothetical protein